MTYDWTLMNIKLILPGSGNTDNFQKNARLLVFLLIVLWLAFSLYIFIQFLLRDLPQPAVVALDEEAVSLQQSRNVDIEQLSSLAIFGDIEAAPVITTTSVVQVSDELLNAEKTKLNIELTGIIYSLVPELGSAVIRYQNKSDQYHIEDKLPVGSNVYLEAVFMDRVIVKNSGVSESVWLYDGEYADIATSTSVTISATKPSTTTSSINSGTIDMRNNESARAVALDLKNILMTEPLSLASLVQVTPHLDGGRIAGYRVTPRGSREEFMALGFEPNDIITSVNGVELDDLGKVSQLYQQLQETSQVSVTVIRDEQILQLMIAAESESNY